jgi:hypothetical protein
MSLPAAAGVPAESKMYFFEDAKDTIARRSEGVSPCRLHLLGDIPFETIINEFVAVVAPKTRVMAFCLRISLPHADFDIYRVTDSLYIAHWRLVHGRRTVQVAAVTQQEGGADDTVLKTESDQKDPSADVARPIKERSMELLVLCSSLLILLKELASDVQDLYTLYQAQKPSVPGGPLPCAQLTDERSFASMWQPSMWSQLKRMFESSQSW